MEPMKKLWYKTDRDSTSSAIKEILFEIPVDVLKTLPKLRSTNEELVTVSDDLNIDEVTDVQISELLAKLGEAKKEKIIKALKDSDIIKWRFFGLNPTFDWVGFARFSSTLLKVLRGWDDVTKKKLIEVIKKKVKYRICHSVRWDLVLARYLSPNVDYTFTISSSTGMKESNLNALTITLATQTISKFVSEVKTGVEIEAKGLGKATTSALSRNELQQQISRALKSESSRQIELSEQREFTEEISCKPDKPGWYSVWQLVDVIEVSRIQRPRFSNSNFSEINELLRPSLIARGETKAQIVINSMSSV